MRLHDQGAGLRKPHKHVTCIACTTQVCLSCSICLQVPAYFDEEQKQATVTAGKIAGLQTVRLIRQSSHQVLEVQLHIATNSEVHSGHLAMPIQCCRQCAVKKFLADSATVVLLMCQSQAPAGRSSSQASCQLAVSLSVNRDSACISQ